MTETPVFRLPPRYLPVSCLGRGGGGEVWAVHDRLTGRQLALKALADDAGDMEAMALVREAVTLNGLEGVGVPRVLAFGSLPGSRRPFLVRELVEGTSLEEVLDEKGEWLRPLAGAADQLTLLHRAGLLHGDIKPANVIVGPDGTGTLVDLGLSAPWREGGSRARGLTPRFAAPELFAGEPLTVRAEVFSLGATLAYALSQRGRELPAPTRKALEEIARRATAEKPHARQPSVDELASALRSAAGLETRAFEQGAAWPIVGFDGAAQELAQAVAKLAPGEAIAVVGPARSGRSTLVRRLAWSLGVSVLPVAALEPARSGGADATDDLVSMELDSWGGERNPTPGLVLVVDDLAGFDDKALARLGTAVEHGARLVAVVGEREESRVRAVAPKGTRVFEVPPLDDASAAELVRRAIPSLPDKLAAHLLDRVARRPGQLRAFVRRLGTSVVTSTADIDQILATPSGKSAPMSDRSRAEVRAELARALDTGRFDTASELAAELGAEHGDDERVELAVARARILAARGDASGAASALDAAKEVALASPLARAWKAARARVSMRAGDFAGASSLAAEVLGTGADDAIGTDALTVRGMALSFLGEDGAIPMLERARDAARALGDPRLEAVALGSLGIAYQRSGRAREAKGIYEAALTAAETAQDAWTIASTRLNLAATAKDDGDLAEALAHLEAVVDLGRRAGGQIAVQQALINLANLDLYLGRYERARASMDRLADQRDRLAPASRAQLLGLQAELATRLGEVERGAHLFQLCSEAYEAVGRLSDMAEARLEGILARSHNTSDTAPTVDIAALERELRELRARFEGGFGKHEALANMVEGTLALARGEEARARSLLDAACESAQRSGLGEWAWRALDARARLAATQGAGALARRDTEAALAMLEETAAKLPRDLREVFWNDPRRRALRLAHSATIPAAMLAEKTQNAPRQGDGRSLGSAITAMSLGRSASLTSLGAPMPAEDKLVRIFEITRDLARETELDRLLQRVVDHAIGLVSAERGLVVLVNDAGEVVAHTARSSKGEESHANFSRSVAEAVIRDGEPVIATSARDDERLAKAVSVHQLMIQSIACVPIRGALPAERILGALYLETRLRPGVRFREELPTLAAFADQAAIAIENARLIDENRRRAEELAVANSELEAAKAKLSELLGRRTEQLASARRDLKEARAQLRSHFGYAGLVGTSAAMRKLYAVIERVKDTDVPVLVTGESGTGKEMVAKAVHTAGPRGKQPFLGVNCGAIPENLLESELFGHVRGAFTGADRDRKGLFREAENGTILLDEIGEMPLKMQAGLLRVLQEKTVRPVGGAKEESCSARVIAATNRGLAQMVTEGRFREDLFYRIQVVELKVPALRERAEDIPALVDHFLGLFAARHKREKKTLARDAVRRLQAYEWPGNVRQLEHVLLNAWLLSEGDEILEGDLDLPTTALRPSLAPSSATPALPVATGASVPPGRPRSHEEHRENEKERILAALTRCNWNRVQAAKALGIPRRTFYRRLKDYGIV